jgi:SAM-dependent methyltransferase
MLRNLLVQPSTRGIDIDDPRILQLRRPIVREKVFLRQVYEEWYAAIVAALPEGEGLVLELGSGPGFLKDFVPKLITSDILCCRGILVVLDGGQLPISDRALRGIAMINVLHHLCQPRHFLAEAVRCLQPGGVVVMIEPWVTPWSRLVYKRLHHEPFQPKASTWESPHKGPLSGANTALPWIIFERDRTQFEREFPELQIRFVEPCMPFKYLVSGGVSSRSLMPGWAFGLWRRIEGCLLPWMKTWAMFALIALVRADT